MADDKVIYEKVEDNVARITLNCPDKLNVWQFVGGMTDQFYSALKEAVDDDDVKVVIIRGAGRAFSAGHDLTEVGFVYGYGSGQPGERRPSQRTRLKLDRLNWWQHHLEVFLCPKITIAQVHGYCIGEGLAIASCCDLAVAAEDAQIGHTEQRLGFAGSGIGTLNILILTVGLKRAVDLMLTGRQIDGTEAERIGLVNKAVSIDKLEEEVMRMAKAMTLLPRDGIAIGKATRHMMYDTLGLTAGFATGYYSHAFFTNLRWESDEYNFFKQRRDKSAKAGFHGRDARYAGLV